MCICSGTDGGLLVYRSAAAGCHCSPARCALSPLQNHGVQRCTFQVTYANHIISTVFLTLPLSVSLALNMYLSF